MVAGGSATNSGDDDGRWSNDDGLLSDDRRWRSNGLAVNWSTADGPMADDRRRATIGGGHKLAASEF